MHGDVIVLGASSWRVDEIGHDRVTVSPAPGVPGKLPFWKGDAVGRPIELGRAMGAFVGELEADLARGAKGRTAADHAPARAPRPRRAGRRRTCSPTSTTSARRPARCPTDKRIVVERFRDELGDWRLCILTPVRRAGPRAVVAGARGAPPRAARARGPDHLVRRRHRDPAARGRRPARRHRGAALPRRRRGRGPGRRAGRDVGAVRQPVPRERGAGAPPAAPPARDADAALAAAPARRRPAGRRLALRQLPDPRRDVSRVPVGRLRPAGAARDPGRRRAPRDRDPRRRDAAGQSPFASSLLFDYVAAYMYDGDAPLAERRAGALTLDRDLLRELLGQEELRELLDPEALADLELSPPGADRRPQGDDARRRARPAAPARRPVARRGGRADRGRAGGRRPAGSPSWRPPGGRSGPGSPARTAGSPSRTSPATATASAYRAPVGVPDAFLAPATGALDGLLARCARTHGPFLTPEPARRWGLPVGIVEDALERLLVAGTLVARRVPAGRRRTRMVRPGRPAPAPPPVAGAAAPRGRAGRPGRARPVPAGLARHRAGRRVPRTAVPWLGGPRAARRGRRPAGRAADPGVRAGARRPAGARPRLPAAAARRARLARRGRLGGAGEPGPRRRPDRPGPPGPRRVLRPVGLARRRGPPERAAPRSRSASTSRPRGASFYRELSPRRAAAARTARCSTRCGTWSGRARSPTTRSRRCARCAGSGPAAAAPGARAAGPAHRARSARGRRPLVARRSRTDRATPTERLHAQALALLERHGVADPRGRRGRGRRRRVRGGLPDPARARGRRAGSGAATSSTASAPRSSRWPGALDRLRAVRDAGERPADGERPSSWPPPIPANPYGAALPWPRRGEHDRRPLQRAAGAYVVLVDGVAALYLERGGSTLQTLPAATIRTSRGAAAAALRDARRRRPAPRAGRQKVDGEDVGDSPVPRAPAGRRVRARLPRPRPAR